MTYTSLAYTFGIRFFAPEVLSFKNNEITSHPMPKAYASPTARKHSGYFPFAQN